ncbi:MAG: hypothetical protein A2939_02910 [Parcubacteria group bacterium RIFCSPLOWO2_01_FULL_48_18]|nr:MAG: hypothetical protein A2939_02910 [Parcubacteria group bacterium RIFCSPLOWO2_01_FULL_48_18]OHB23032.1 MAG: hypothetical protein A3J67_04060 [Parcubacteria group bacterium RIFCSPHIGHO2_02_FULL_48_10b]
MNKILDSTNFVVQNSRFVKINKARVAEFSMSFEHGRINHWLSQAPFDFSNFSEDEELRFTLIFNSLSFCFWGDPKWTIENNGRFFDGAWGMVVALGRAIKEKFPLLDFEYCLKLSKDDFQKILRANAEIPLFNERLNILHEIGTVMAEKYGGRIDSLLEPANGDALKLLEIIVQNFPSFRDVSRYKEKEIYFYKRAQLLVSDLCQMLSKRGILFKNVDQLTACADYKLPQILRRFGIFEYVPSLAEKIDNKIEIPHDSKEEIEIRANTIRAVEFIKGQVKARNPKITSMGIDDHLWLASQEKFPDEKPYHRTKTTDY